MTDEKLIEMAIKAFETYAIGLTKKETDRLIALARVGASVMPKPTHRHIKTGSLYTMLGSGAVQSTEPLQDMQAVVIYRAEKDGSLWAREFHEFHDASRFEPLPKPNEVTT